MKGSIVIRECQVPIDKDATSSVLVVRQNRARKQPTLLICTPYPRESVLAKWSAIQLARSGWNLVVASSRGRYGSRGVFKPFEFEHKDTQIIVAWCSNQNWSNQKIVMAGTSYEGFAQWQCASNNDAILAIAPTLTGSNLKDWFFENGAFKHAFAQSWGLSLVYTNEISTIGKVSPKVIELASDLTYLYSISPSKSPLLSLLSNYRDWIGDTKDIFFDHIYSHGHPDNCLVPVYFSAGWNDIFLNATLKDYNNRALRKTDRLVIGPWSHDSIGKTIDGDIDYGFEADPEVFNLYADQMQWFENIILKKENTVNVSFFLMGANEWMHSDRWPVESIQKEVTLDLDNNGYTSINTSVMHMANRERGSAVIIVDPQLPKRSFGGKKHDPTLPNAGSKILNQWIDYQDPILLISEGIEVIYNVIGCVKIDISLISNAKIIDLYIVLGVLNERDEYVSYLEGINRLDLDVTTKNNFFDLSIGNTAFSVLKGQKLFLAISGCCFPSFDNPYSDLEHNVIIKFVSGTNTLCLPISS